MNALQMTVHILIVKMVCPKYQNNFMHVNQALKIHNTYRKKFRTSLHLSYFCYIAFTIFKRNVLKNYFSY